MGIREEKNDIRRRYKSTRSQISPQDKENMDNQILKFFLSTLGYRYSNGILAYMSIENEVDTKKMITAAFNSGKRVALPKCDPSKRTMNFYEIKSFDDLEKGMFNIMEPNTWKCHLADISNYSICLVPAVVYDIYGCRLGYGHGYYDRFLEHYKGVSMGLIYTQFIIDDLPKGRYDKTVDLLITEKGVRRSQKWG